MEQTAVDEESFYIRNDKVLILNYQESAIRKPVVLISTASHAGDQQVVSRGRVAGIKPTAVASYNQQMGDVERHRDKSVYHVTCSRKPKSYWRKIIYSLVDVALLNSYILYCHQSNRPMQRWEYMSETVFFRYQTVHQALRVATDWRILSSVCLVQTISWNRSQAKI